MAINYSKVGWDSTKYFNPTNMNHMDDALKSACDNVDELNNNLANMVNIITISGTTDSNGLLNLSDFIPNGYIPLFFIDYAYVTTFFNGSAGGVRPYLQSRNYNGEILSNHTIDSKHLIVIKYNF